MKKKLLTGAWLALLAWCASMTAYAQEQAGPGLPISVSLNFSLPGHAGQTVHISGYQQEFAPVAIPMGQARLSNEGTATWQGQVPHAGRYHVSVQEGTLNGDFYIDPQGAYSLAFNKNQKLTVASEPAPYVNGAINDMVRQAERFSIVKYLRYWVTPATTRAKRYERYAQDAQEGMPLYTSQLMEYKVLGWQLNTLKDDSPEALAMFDACEARLLGAKENYWHNPAFFQALSTLMRARMNYLPAMRARAQFSQQEPAWQAGFREAAFFPNPEMVALGQATALLNAYKSGWFGPARDMADLNRATDSLAKADGYLYPKLLESLLLQQNTVHVGEAFPAFEVATLDGRTDSLDSFHGKYVLVDFWATWCNICIKEMGQFEALLEQEGDRLEIVSISVDEDFERVTRLMDRKGFGWNLWHDGRYGRYAQLFDLRALPQYYLLDAEGRLVKKFDVSFSPFEDLQNHLPKR